MRYSYAIERNDLEIVDIGVIREQFKELGNFADNIEGTLRKYGWELDNEYNSKDYRMWKKGICVGGYESEVRVAIAYEIEQLSSCHQYGVQWVECCYEYENHYKSSLCDMYNCMRIAIEMLLAKGIPMHPESDLMREREYWHFTYQEEKRNTDLLNATNLLKKNYEDLKELCGYDDEEMREFYETRRNKGEYKWILDYIKE